MSIFAGKDPIWTARRGAVSAGLVGHWDSMALSAADRMGNIWYDISGNNNHGTLTNGASFDRIGVNFDGVNDLVILGNSTVTGLSAVTFSFWGKRNSPTDNLGLVQGNSENSRMFVSKGGDGRFYIGGRFPLNDHFSSVNPDSSDVGKWTHYCGVIITNTAINLGHLVYVNGIQQTLGNSSNANTVSAFPVFTTPIQLGERFTGSATTFNTGQLDDLRFYNRALSNAEILRNFNATRARFGV